MAKEKVSIGKYSKDDMVEVEITDIGTEGEGIGKVCGYTLFIKDAVIGDTVRAKIMKMKKNYGYAHLEEVLNPSPFRQEAPCPIARQCGGCQLQNMTYERQLVFKQSKVRNNIVRLGGFEESFIDGIMEPIMGMGYPWRYRNKAQYPIGPDRNGKPIAGFYAARTHSIIPVSDCLIGITENQEILDTILEHMNSFHVSAYDETSGHGLVRHVLIRKGFESSEIMVCLVLNYGKHSVQFPAEKKRDFIPGQERLIDALTKIQGMTSISVSINNENTNVIMGTEIHTIWGRDTIKDTLMGMEFEISPLSFYQVNPLQTKKLYSTAIEYANLTGRETVWDLYCGIGTITLSMAKAAGKVYGVEIIPEAIEDAKKNAEQNHIDNAEFMCGRAEVVLPEFYAKENKNADVIVVDPPRKGCDEKCLETMLKMAPDRIVYVSCDSATLARDLRILAGGGYELKRIRPCDMFSWSSHVETVVLLTRTEGTTSEG